MPLLAFPRALARSLPAPAVIVDHGANDATWAALEAHKTISSSGCLKRCERQTFQDVGLEKQERRPGSLSRGGVVWGREEVGAT